MNYQATAYRYNQRSEVLIPERKGTTYFSTSNHQPLVAYQGIVANIEFAMKDSDRCALNLVDKTFTAQIVDRSTNAVVLTKVLIVINWDMAILCLHLTASELATLSTTLYDVIITYTESSDTTKTYGMYSDQNFRFTFVLEVKQNPAEVITPSSEATTLSAPQQGELVTSPFPSTGQTENSDGTNTVAVYLTNFTGKFYAEATLEMNPLDRDWFNITLDEDCITEFYEFTNETGVVPFSWDGMFVWVRFRFTFDVNVNVGTVDKILYRA